MKKVMVLEDESSIRSFIVINLRRAGYDVIEAETGEEALAKQKENPDTRVALLDIMLPGIDGFEVCRRIRATNAAIGIIMLTARSQEMDKVTGLMTGADDYVTKPFSPAELTARVDALTRRSGGCVAVGCAARHPPRAEGRRGNAPARCGVRRAVRAVPRLRRTAAARTRPLSHPGTHRRGSVPPFGLRLGIGCQCTMHRTSRLKENTNSERNCPARSRA